MNTRRAAIFSLLISALFICQSRLWAWGPVGHDVVALIAESRLSPEAKNQVASILGPQGNLEEVANCADWIKYAKQDVSCGNFTLPPMPETASWHFIDIPINSQNPSGAIGSACGSDGQCSIDQIESHLQVLSDSSASLNQKQQALMFVTHLVGDLHQPLHNATEILPDGTSDRGGNLKKMSFESGGKATNLHALWDDLIEPASEAKTMDPESLAQTLEGEISDQDAVVWANASLADMALEGYEIAQNQIYPDYHASGGDMVTSAYEDEMRPVVDLRLEKAGVRLATLLNKAFAPAPVILPGSYEPISLKGKIPSIQKMVLPAVAAWGR